MMDARVCIGLMAGVALIAASCGREPREARPAPAHALMEYASADTLFPRLRLADGQVTVNDRCMVRQSKLNRRLPPVFVNGRPVGFC